MRWKLLVGLGITWFGLGITRLFQHAGIIPLDTPLDWTLMGPAALEVRPAMLFRCTGNCVDGLFVDSAHGPPFLTVTGICWYTFCPAPCWPGGLWRPRQVLRQGMWGRNRKAVGANGPDTMPGTRNAHSRTRSIQNEDPMRCSNRARFRSAMESSFDKSVKS
jgi:hypothetical protein